MSITTMAGFVAKNEKIKKLEVENKSLKAENRKLKARVKKLENKE